MSEMKFIASVVNCYTENDVLIIGIGNATVAPDNYLVISRFDDGDVDNSIGIQTHLSEIEIANAIDSIILNKEFLTVKIKNNKINELHFQNIIVEFEGGNINYELLKKYINNIYGGSSVKVTISL